MFSSEQLAGILAALPDPGFVLTRSGRYAAVFGGSDPRYYHDGSGLVGQLIGNVLNDAKASWFLAEIAKTLEEGRLRVVEYGLAGSDVRGLDSEGPSEPIWFEGRVQPLPFQIDGEDAVFWIATNITVRHALEQQLRELSETDELTSVHNRRHFERAAAAEMERSARYGHPLSLLLLDIDHFKLVNDTCGHKVGDEVLVEFASLIQRCIRGSDLVSRWGGEEFTLLLPSTTLEMAVAAADKLRLAVESHRFPSSLRLTVSVGAAEWCGAGEPLDAWLRRADAALYRAKGGGRNRVSVAPRTSADTSSTEVTQQLHWHPRYECGEPSIDADHRRLFDEVNQAIVRLARANDGDAAQRREAVDAFDRVVEDTRRHFAEEEQLLAELEWSDLAEHRAEHRRLLARAEQLRGGLSDGDDATVLAALSEFLFVELVANHVLRSDRRYFPLLAAR